MNIINIGYGSCKIELLVPCVQELDDRYLGPDSWSLTQWLDSAQFSHYFLFIDCSQGNLRGFSLYSFVPGDGAHLLKIVSTQPRQGIGKRLIEASRDYLREREAMSCYLEVRVTNKSAIEFYQSLGFIQLIKKERFYADNEDAVAMHQCW